MTATYFMDDEAIEPKKSWVDFWNEFFASNNNTPKPFLWSDDAIKPRPYSPQKKPSPPSRPKLALSPVIAQMDIKPMPLIPEKQYAAKSAVGMMGLGIGAKLMASTMLSSVGLGAIAGLSISLATSIKRNYTKDKGILGTLKSTFTQADTYKKAAISATFATVGVIGAEEFISTAHAYDNDYMGDNSHCEPVRDIDGNPVRDIDGNPVRTDCGSYSDAAFDETESTQAESVQIETSSYTIEKGDNLWNIAKEHYNLTNKADIMNAVDKIAEINCMHDLEANGIREGQTLSLPTDIESPTAIKLDWEAINADIKDGNGPSQMWSGNASCNMAPTL